MPELDRRTFLRATATTGIAAALGWSVSSCDERAEAASCHPAIWSDLLCQASGTNTHMDRQGTVYRNHAAVLDRLHRVGVRYVRDRLGVGNSTQHAAFRSFRAAGIKVHSTVAAGTLMATRADVDDFMEKAAELGGPAMFTSFEGPNEPNTNGGGQWVSRTIELMRWIREARDAHGLSSIPIAGPALNHRTAVQEGDYAKLAEAGVARYTDLGALHYYAGGRNLAKGLDGALAMVRPVYSGQPIFLTETGWNTGLHVVSPGQPVPLDVQAVYARKAVAQAFARHVRVSLYEALDEAPGTGISGWEAHFGHLAECPSLDPSTWRDKPVLARVGQLLAACADPGPACRPAPLRARIRKPRDVRKLVLGKRNGSHLVLLWRDVDVYDNRTRRRVDVGVRHVSISTPRRTHRVAVGRDLVALHL